MFGVSIYMMFMGGFYDRLMAGKLPAGASLDTYRSAAAGPEVLMTTLIIPVVLILAFAVLVFYMRKRNSPKAPEFVPVNQNIL